MFCTKCGKENLETDKFCAFCGAPLRHVRPNPNNIVNPGTQTTVENGVSRKAENVVNTQHQDQGATDNSTQDVLWTEKLKKKRKVIIACIIAALFISSMCVYLMRLNYNPVGTWVVSSGYATVDYYEYNIPLPLTNNVALEPLDEGSDLSGGRDADVEMHQFMVSDEDYILEMGKDGYYSLTAFDFVEWGTWYEIDDGTLAFCNNDDGSETYASFEDGNIVFADMGTEYILKRQ